MRDEKEIRKWLEKIREEYKNREHKHCSAFMHSVAIQVLEWVLEERDLFEYEHNKIGGGK